MKVLACDGIHEDGCALFRGAGWTMDLPALVTAESNGSHRGAAGVNIVKLSLGAKGNGEALAAITVDREVAAAQLVALRGIPGVLELEAV